MPFSGDFSEFPELWPRFSFDLRNYDSKIHHNLRNYGYQFLGQNGTSPSDDRSRYKVGWTDYDEPQVISTQNEITTQYRDYSYWDSIYYSTFLD